MNQEIIDLLKKIRVEASKCTPNWAIIQSLAGEAWSIIEQQPTAGEFTKKVRSFVKMYENEIPRRAEITFLEEALDIIDTSEEIINDLLEACEGLMEKADNGSADFDDPEPGSIYLKAKAAISKAKKLVTK